MYVQERKIGIVYLGIGYANALSKQRHAANNKQHHGRGQQSIIIGIRLKLRDRVTRQVLIIVVHTEPYQHSG